MKDAVFVERPNRFLTVVRIDRRQVESHLPDPGRLKELLIPGARLKVRKAPSPAGNRKTRWTTVLVKTGNQWVSIDSTLPNRFVRELLLQGDLPFLRAWKLVGDEVKCGRHRFDFLLERGSRKIYLEVKSVTLVMDGVAMFPDAVTERGTRHMNALAELVREGIGAAVLFVCQRPDVRLFRPQWDRDPRFAKSLLDAQKQGVDIWVVSARVSPAAIELKEEVPYDLTPF